MDQAQFRTLIATLLLAPAAGKSAGILEVAQNLRPTGSDSVRGHAETSIKPALDAAYLLADKIIEHS